MANNVIIGSHVHNNGNTEVPGNLGIARLRVHDAGLTAADVAYNFYVEAPLFIASATPTRSTTPTGSLTSTGSPSNTASPSSSLSGGVSVSPTQTNTPSSSRSGTGTQTPSVTASITGSASGTPTPSSTPLYAVAGEATMLLVLMCMWEVSNTYASFKNFASLIWRLTAGSLVVDLYAADYNAATFQWDNRASAGSFST